MQKSFRIWQIKNQHYNRWYTEKHSTAFFILWQILQQKTLGYIPYASRKDEVLLDVGCGDGRYLAPAVKEKGYVSVGIDPNSIVSLKPAKDRMKKAKLEPLLVKSVGEFIPLKTSAASVVICNSALDHTMEPEAVLQEIRRVLKEDGRLIMWQGIYSHKQTEHETQEQETHLRSFSKAALVSMLEDEGFSLTKIELMGFDAVSSSGTNRSMAAGIPKFLNGGIFVFIKLYLMMGRIIPQHASVALLSFKKTFSEPIIQKNIR